MNTFKKLFFIFTAFAIIFVFNHKALSYSQETTHPQLTREIVKFYNLFADNKISDKYAELIVRASIEEDANPRWLNHFYDPVYNRPLTISSIKLGEISKYWAQSSRLQNIQFTYFAAPLGVVQYFISGAYSGDYSWEEGIKQYAKGNKEKAFEILGHTLHLIEDVTVPAHTRNDPHPVYDSYEHWTKEASGNLSIGLAEKFYNLGYKPTVVENLEKYFDEVASYTNNNFFSNDTFNEYNYPKINKYVLVNGDYYGISLNGQKLVKLIKVEDANYYNFTLEDETSSILNSYWSHLSRQAILNGAGIIKLFIEEGEKALKEKQESQNWWEVMLSYVGSIFDNVFGQNEENIETDGEQNQAADLFYNASLMAFAPQNLSLKEGDTVNLSVEFKNSGTETWQANNVSLNIANNESAFFYDFSWATTKRPVILNKDILPGGSATFSFKIKIPQINEESLSKIFIVRPVYYKDGEFNWLGNDSVSFNIAISKQILQEENATYSAVNNVENNTPEEIIKEIISGLISSENQQEGGGSSYYTVINSSDDNSQNIGEELGNDDEEGGEAEEEEENTQTDAIKPATVENFKAQSGQSRGAINLSWSAPQDIDANGNATASAIYLIKYFDKEIVDDLITASENQIRFSEADDILNAPLPANPGETQSINLDNLIPGTLYYFAIKSIDASGNISEMSVTQAKANAKSDHVVINEIQISDDEFIELYNPTDNEIDMTGWYFSYYSKNKNWNNPHRNKEFSSAAKISAGGYYLIGLKGYSDEGGNPSADWQPYTSNQLNNNDGAIAIFFGNPDNATNAQDILIDAVGWGDVLNVKEGTSTIAPDKNKSIQRENGWDTDNNFFDFSYQNYPNPTNSLGEKKYGTYIDDDYKITSDELWEKEGSPYFLMSNSGDYPIVKAGATLTIGPGVALIPQNSYYTALKVEGTLNIEGTSENPVLVTSKNDVDYKGDGNVQKGDWKNIWFTSGSKGNIKNVIFQYGGHWEPYGDQPELIKTENAEINFENVKFLNSAHRGISFINSKFSFSGYCEFANNVIGIYIEGATDNSEIRNCVFGDNDSSYGVGISLGDSADVKIINNDFINANLPVQMVANSQPYFKSNIMGSGLFEGYYQRGVYVFAGAINKDTTWQADMPYLLESNSGSYVTVPSEKTLTLMPGVILKPLNKYYYAMSVQGVLNAIGTEEKPIIITSYKDDNYGGDSNGDGENTLPSIGDWKSVYFSNSSGTSTIANAVIKYGGYWDIGAGPRTDGPMIEQGPGAMVDLGENIVFE